MFYGSLFIISSQQKTQLLYFHLSYKETCKQLAQILQTHSRQFGGFVKKKDKETKESVVKTLLDFINLTI